MVLARPANLAGSSGDLATARGAGARTPARQVVESWRGRAL